MYKRALVAASALAALSIAPAHAEIPPWPQGYPIQQLYQACTNSEAHAAGYPDWHYGETARRYLTDGTLEFKNTTDQTVSYTAKVESGTNHVIEANSAAELPSGWNTTAKTDIGATTDNGWIEGETFGPIQLGPGESFRVEFGVLEKDFVAMFVDCHQGFYQNQPGSDVIRGTAPAERYAFASIIRADGNVDNQALDIPSRAQGANSKPVGGTYHASNGPSLEKVANPAQDKPLAPATTPQRDPSWPKFGDKCTTQNHGWFPHEISGVSPTFRKPGYSQDFLNWSEGEYTFTPIVDHVVGAQFNGQMNYWGNHGRLPEGWLESIGAGQRAYLPVGTALNDLVLQPGDRVRVEYGTTMMRVNYSEFTCKNGQYTLTNNLPTATAPAGFWAEATITGRDGSKRVVDVLPTEWTSTPLPTQTAF
ncbi:hypothetical protein [Corynebacterium epidermidicanis]|uniref:Secreted protein n=1 Tax=Corynebacterium epidermidicanis TaxID=1050174 RepID=A0A0G3GT18_9CORY|nr:hypothetical protein [Corynebacterium epidermidicanis]AKK02007.1 hypothetical protein CEPID_00565 [Corynebacterium epidermidicanis]